jgi:hypothetical protein
MDSPAGSGTEGHCRNVGGFQVMFGSLGGLITVDTAAFENSYRPILSMALPVAVVLATALAAARLIDTNSKTILKESNTAEATA